MRTIRSIRIGSSLILLITGTLAARAQEDAVPHPSLSEGILDVAREVGIEEELSIQPVKGSDRVEARFRGKAGFEMRSLLEFLAGIERKNAAWRVESVAFGRRDPGTDVWRPLALSVRADPPSPGGDRPPSALSRLDGFLGAIRELSGGSPDLTVDRLEVGARHVAWNMTSSQPETFTKLKPLLLRLPGARVAEPGRLSTKDGLHLYESARLEFADRAPSPEKNAALVHPLASLIRDAARRADPGEEEIVVRKLGVAGDAAEVDVSCAGAGALGRLVAELRRDGACDGLLLLEARAEEGRLLVTGRITLRR